MRYRPRHGKWIANCACPYKPKASGELQGICVALHAKWNVQLLDDSNPDQTWVSYATARSCRIVLAFPAIHVIHLGVSWFCKLGRQREGVHLVSFCMDGTQKINLRSLIINGLLTTVNPPLFITWPFIIMWSGDSRILSFSATYQDMMMMKQNVWISLKLIFLFIPVLLAAQSSPPPKNATTTKYDISKDPVPPATGHIFSKKPSQTWLGANHG